MFGGFLKKSALRTWIIPALLFAISTQDARLSQFLKVPVGTVMTTIQVLFSIYIAWCARKTFSPICRWFFLVPVMVAISDFFYGFGIYVFRLPLPNHYQCLLYIIPTMIEMTLIIRGQLRLMKKTDSRRVLFWIGIGVSLGLFALTTMNIIIPALFHKEPPLPLLLQALTVLYSGMESAVIGFSAALLLCASAGALQIGLFGAMAMHISDMAIRYQSVHLELMGFSVFEYGWCLGLMLVAVSATQFYSWKRVAPVRALTAWVQLSSIRGMTIGAVLGGFVALWIGFSVYFHSIGSAVFSASMLLILTMMFAFAIILADLVTRQVNRAVHSIQNEEEFKTAQMTPFVPQEIKIMMGHFEKLTKEIAAEKNHVLQLTSGVTHDLRGPLRSLENMIPFVREAKNNENAMRHLDVIAECVVLMRKTVNDLLHSRKVVVEGDPIGDAVKNAVRVTSMSHMGSQILVDAPEEICGPRVHGLTRVLNNLLDNAVEASPPHTPVHVIVRRRPDAGGYWIAVKDQGGGIPEQVRERVEAGESVTTKKDGNGLALSFMVSWAKRHGIKYEIDSMPGYGTEVSLHIPMVDA